MKRLGDGRLRLGGHGLRENTRLHEGDVRISLVRIQRGWTGHRLGCCRERHRLLEIPELGAAHGAEAVGPSPLASACGAETRIPWLHPNSPHDRYDIISFSAPTVAYKLCGV
jgi:hypothetical protein